MQNNNQTQPMLASITFTFLEKKSDGSPELRMFTSRSSGIGFGMFGVGEISDPDYMNPSFIYKPGDTTHRFANTLFGKLRRDTNFDGLFWKIMNENIFGVLFEYDDGTFFFYHPIFSGNNGFEENTFQDQKLLDDGSLFFGISSDKTLDEMLEIYQEKLAPKFEELESGSDKSDDGEDN